MKNMKNMNNFYYIEDYPQYGMINLSKVESITPQDFQLNIHEDEFIIRVRYNSSHNDTLNFHENKILRDAIMRSMNYGIASICTSHDELNENIEMISHENVELDVKKLQNKISKERVFIDPTNLDNLPRVTVD
jgi:hypothetical protein